MRKSFTQALDCLDVQILWEIGDQVIGKRCKVEEDLEERVHVASVALVDKSHLPVPEADDWVFR